jgi:hypothetical protein
METSSALDLLALLGEGDALGGDGRYHPGFSDWPSCIVEHEQDDPRESRGLPRESFEQSLEKFLRHSAGNIPEGFAGGR